MGADYPFEVIFNENCAPQFNGHNKSFLASVSSTEVLNLFIFIFSENCKTEVNRLKTESLALEPIEIAPGIEVKPTPIMSQADQKVENALTDNDCTQRLV